MIRNDEAVKMNVKSTLISLISFILIVCFLGHQVLGKKGGSNIVIGGGESALHVLVNLFCSAAGDWPD